MRTRAASQSAQAIIAPDDPKPAFETCIGDGKMKLRREVFWPVVVLIACLASPYASACSCIAYDVTDDIVIDRLCSADVVIVGFVESSMLLRDHFVEYKIRTEETVKGPVSSPTYAISDSNSCSYSFQSQRRYLIFGRKYENTAYISASICDLTRPMQEPHFILEILRDAKDHLQDLCSEDAVAERRRRVSVDRIVVPDSLEQRTRELLEGPPAEE